MDLFFSAFWHNIRYVSEGGDHTLVEDACWIRLRSCICVGIDLFPEVVQFSLCGLSFIFGVLFLVAAAVLAKFEYIPASATGICFTDVPFPSNATGACILAFASGSGLNIQCNER